MPLEVKNIKLILPLFLILFTFNVTLASSPGLKDYKYQSDFKDGEFNKVTLANPGYLTLSPRVISFFDSGEPYLWAWTRDSKGNIFVGTGNDGKVFKIAPNKNSVVFFDAEELEIYALATDKKDHLYVASSPEGKIYKVSPEGKVQVYFDPPDKYIWDLVFDSQENLFAATGDSCRIYKIAGVNQAQLFFKSEESHVQVLLVNPDNSLLAGTVDNGYLYKIESSSKTRILFDTGFREIHSLANGQDGSIYLGVYGQKLASEIPPIKGQKEDKAPMKIEDKEDEGKEPTELEEIQIVANAPEMPDISKPGFGVREQSAVFKLTPEGAQQNIWNLNETVYSIVMNKDGSLIVGTGGTSGKLYQLNQNEEESELLDMNDAQISALYLDPNDHIFMCTSNMGKIYEISHQFENEGSYTSSVFNTDLVADWGLIRWEAEIPEGTQIRFFTRSGNTAEANQTWSEWSQPYVNEKGSTISSPSAQYLQWKAVFKSQNEKNTPRLNRTTFSFLQRNLSPMIKYINVNNPEEALQEIEQDVEEYYPEKPESSSDSQSASPAVNQQMSRKRMVRTVRWACADDNQDRLLFNLFYRDQISTNWRIMQKNIIRPSLNWDSRKWPDGRYKIKIEATDAPVNPPDLAKTVEKESEWFVVDNTGPTVDDFKLTTMPNGLQLHFKNIDEFSSIYLTEYVIDNEAWKIVFPIDKISDSPVELFKIETNQLSKGSHSLVVRSYDRFLNVGFGKYHFKVE